MWLDEVKMNYAMKKITFLVVCIFATIGMRAGIPETNYGEFGIKYLSSIEEYQQLYLGKTVVYYPAVPYLSSSTITKDDSYFESIGGRLGSKYTICKITGTSQQMTFLLVGQTDKKKVKMVINTTYDSKNWLRDHNYNINANNIYVVSTQGSVPLILIDEFQEAAKQLIGKQIPEIGTPLYKLEKVELAQAARPLASYQEDKSYPVFAATFTNINTGTQIVYRTSCFNDILLLGNHMGAEFPKDVPSPLFRVIDLNIKETLYKDSYKYNPADLDGKKIDIEYSVQNLRSKEVRKYSENLLTYFIPIVSDYAGKTFPENPKTDYYYEVVDITPSSLTLENAQTGTKRVYSTKSVKSLLNAYDHLGEIVHDEDGFYKADYTICDVFDSLPYSYAKDKEIFVVAVNSINEKKKTVSYSNYKKSVFYGDASGRFDAVLSKVEKPANSAVRYGKKTTISDNTDGITRYSYVDNIIDILIFATDKQFSFILKNMSDNTIKVVWDEAVFVDVDGSTSKVFHYGVKYADRENRQPVSTIIKGANLDDVATPTNRVEFYKDWYTKSLFINSKKDVKDQKIKLMLPIQVKDVVNEYIFEFSVNYVFNYPELVNHE